MTDTRPRCPGCGRLIRKNGIVTSTRHRKDCTVWKDELSASLERLSVWVNGTSPRRTSAAKTLRDALYAAWPEIRCKCPNDDPHRADCKVGALVGAVDDAARELDKIAAALAEGDE